MVTGREPTRGKIQKRYTQYPVQEMVGNQAHRGKLGIWKGRRTLRGCKEAEGSQKAGARGTYRDRYSKERKKARHGEFKQQWGLDSETHLPGSNSTCIWWLSLNQQPEAKGESQRWERQPKGDLPAFRRRVGQHSWLRCLFLNKIFLRLLWFKN